MQSVMPKQHRLKSTIRGIAFAALMFLAIFSRIATASNGTNPIGVPPVRVLYLDGHTAQYKVAFQEIVNAWSRTSGIPISIVIPKVTGVLVVDEYMSMLNIMTAQNKSFWDIVYIDVIWPALYTNLLLPLNNHLSPGFLERFDPGFIPAATVDNQVYVLPESTPKVGLYYRADLLAKYNFTSPPKTWAQVEHMIKTIVPAERALGNAMLEGYIGQFAPYEGLTCNLMELLGTPGGMIEPDNTLSVVSNPTARSQTLAIMSMFQRWFREGLIPASGIQAGEEQGRKLYQSGQVVFMRNWHIKSYLAVEGGIGAIAPMPGLTEEVRGMATNGANYLGVNRNTIDKARTVKALEYLLSEDPQWWWVRQAGQLPTKTSMLSDASLCNLTETCTLANLTIISRPSAQTGAKYPKVSAIIFNNWHAMLANRMTPEECLEKMTWDLADLLNINLLGPALSVEWSSPTGITAVIAHLICQLVVVAAAFPIVAQRKHWSREQRRASPRLILALLFGLLLLNGWSLSFVGLPTTDACIVRTIMPGLAWSIVLAVMAVQDLQVYLIMTSPLRAVAMSVNQRLRVYLVASQLIQWTLTAVYLVLARPVPTIVKVGRSYQYASCQLSSSRNVPSETEMITLIVPIVLMAVNAWLAARTEVVENMKTVSRVPVLRVVYLILVTGLISITVTMVQLLDPSTRALVISASSLIQTVGVVRLYVLPRLAPETSSSSSAWMGESAVVTTLPERLGSSMHKSQMSSGTADEDNDSDFLRKSEFFTCRTASSAKALDLKPSLPCLVVLLRECGTLLLVEAVNGKRRRHAVKLDRGRLSSVEVTAQTSAKSLVVQGLKLLLQSGKCVEMTCSGASAHVSRTVGQWKAELAEFVSEAEGIGGPANQERPDSETNGQLQSVGIVQTLGRL